MTEEEKRLLARVVEGLLMLDGRELSRDYSTSLLDAAFHARVTDYMPGWRPNEEGARIESERREHKDA